MLDWFAVAAAAPLLLLVLLLSFVGCTLLFDVQEHEDSSRITIYVYFDPSFGGDFPEDEWPPDDAFAIRVAIHDLNDEDDQPKMVSVARTFNRDGLGLVGYELTTSLRPGDYTFTCEVSVGDPGEVIVESGTCEVTVGLADRLVQFRAELGSHHFNECSDAIQAEDR